MVLIETWQHTIDLASDIALECLRTGAKPLVTLMTDRLWWKALEEISGSTLARERCMFRTGSSTRKIWLEGLSQPSSRQERSKSLRLRPLVGELSRSTRLEH